MVLGMSAVSTLGYVLFIPALLMFGLVEGYRHPASFVIVPAITLACVESVIQATVQAGQFTVSTLMMQPEWNLDATSIRTITISFIIGQGSLMWMFALDDVLVALALGAAAVLTYKHARLPRRVFVLSLIGSILALLTFAFDVAQLTPWSGASFGAVALETLLNVVMVPAWICAISQTLSAHIPPVGSPHELRDFLASRSHQDDVEMSAVGLEDVVAEAKATSS